MILAEIYKIRKRVFGVVLCGALIFSITGCSKEAIKSEESNEVTKLKFFLNDTEIPVIWEENTTVEELFGETADGDIVAEMSMYGGNEQVGPLGRTYTRNDCQTTTQAGDIVLYNGNQIVIFYGSNTWSYTRLGKMDLSKEEITELLSKGDITVTIKR